MKPVHDPRENRRLVSRYLPAILLGAGLLASVAAMSARAAATEKYEAWRPDDFLQTWLVLGPIPVSSSGGVDEAARRKAFADDVLAAPEIGKAGDVEPTSDTRVAIAGTNLVWRVVTSPSEIVDLAVAAGAGDDAIAYAYAEVNLAEATRALIGIGSDDGVRVWVNGALVHENWLGRPARPDDDLVPVQFRQGRNRLLIKIQNLQGPWGFVCRRMGPESLGGQLMAAARGGDLDRIKVLAEHGADLNRPAPQGLTAGSVARIHGHRDIVDFLAERGVDVSTALPDPATLVEGRFSVLFKADGPGAAVLVARKGEVLFEKGYGLADIGHQVPVTPDTRFRIGSVTKQFAAAAILKLQEEGRLSVTNTLSQYFPGFPRGDEVTIHHLLTHTSGIHSFTSKPDFLETVTVGVKPEEHIRSFQNDPYDFDPGQRWLYNNSGYFLLGAIIEKASGLPLDAYLRRTFFDPLGMKDTGVHEARAILPHEATGYLFEGARFQKALDWDMSRAGAAGALYSTVRDLHRWNEAVFSGRVLSAASLAAAFTLMKTRDDPADEVKEAGYGYGWSIQRFRGLQEISHGGGLHGFVSFLLRVPKEDFTAIVLVNCAPPPPGVDPGGLAHEITEFYLADALAPRPSTRIDMTVTADALGLLVGRYNYGNAFLDVSRDGDKLFAQLTGQPRHQIYPRSATNFFWKVVEAEMSFIKDASGVVTGAVHRQGGQTIRAPRVSEKPAVAVATEALDTYTGRYDYGGGKAILTVTREGGQLLAQMTGQPRFEIFATSETNFAWKIVPAHVTFVKGTDGKVAKLIHEQGGTRIEARKLE